MFEILTSDSITEVVPSRKGKKASSEFAEFLESIQGLKPDDDMSRLPIKATTKQEVLKVRSFCMRAGKDPANIKVDGPFRYAASAATWKNKHTGEVTEGLIIRCKTRGQNDE